MTTQNWPDPMRPGVPLFPDYHGQHVLQDANGGKILSLWVSNRLNNRKWDIPSFYSQEPERVARDFTYVSCKAIMLTPAQINEMLAAERERAAKAAQEVSDTYYEQRQEAERRMYAAQECAEAIRNLGSAP